MTDPIADMIIRIKNGYLARRSEVRVPHSKVKEAIAHLLEKEGYVSGVSFEETTTGKMIILTLKYKGTMPAVTEVKRLSKPGMRRYSTVKKIPRSLGGYGLTIVSTSAGVLSDKDARAKGIGGELLCSIW